MPAHASRKAASSPRAPKERGSRIPELRLIKGALGQHTATPSLEALRPPASPQREDHRTKLTHAQLLRRDGLRLLVLSMSLTVFGLVMVLSASSVESINTAGTPWSLFEKQVMWAVIGAVCCVVGARIDLRRLRQMSLPMLVLSGAMLVAVLVPGLGTTVGGSSRWIGFGPLRVQPSEFAKVAFVVFLADLVTRREHRDDQVHAIVKPAMLTLGLMGILILKQPDMGTAMVLACIAAAMLFAAGIDRRVLAIVLTGFIVAGGVLTLSQAYRRERFFAFLHPFSNPTGSSYQIVQSLVALGSGHLTGTGIGGSLAKWDLLPNAWTDFIFAIIGNELGLLGALAVIAAFVAFAYYGIRIASRAKDRFSSLLAIGITCWIVAQAFINIGGVESALPETGIPLPFVSSGGSSLVVALFAAGLLYNIAARQRTGSVAAARGLAWTGGHRSKAPSPRRTVSRSRADSTLERRPQASRRANR